MSSKQISKGAIIIALAILNPTVRMIKQPKIITL